MDIRTLIIALLAHLALLGTLAIYFGTRQTGTRAVRIWGGGMLMLASGFGAIALRGAVPELLSITVANTLLMAANLFFYRALRVMQGSAVDDPLGFAALAATTVLIYLYSEVVPNLGARVMVMSCIAGLFYVRNALVLRAAAPAEVRVAQSFMQGLFWVAAGLSFSRVLVTLRDPGSRLMDADASQGIFFLLFLLLATAACFGVFWMENQYLHYELARRAARDSLTGMLNRGALLGEFERALARTRRGSGALSVAMFDLDLFKRLNDAHGHQAGDEVLRAVAASIFGSIRQPDILGRYGGEEFALVMPETDVEAAMRVAERVRAAVQARGVHWQGRRLAITISGGVAAFPAHGDSCDTLIAAADAALYEAKRDGRNRIARAIGNAAARPAAAPAAGPETAGSHPVASADPRGLDPPAVNPDRL